MAEKSNKVLLQVKGLKVAYGGIQAVKGVDFEVREGELVSLIGSNGAGKTTTMKAITGTLPLAGGDIEYLGKSIKGQGPWDLVKQGLAMVPEGRGVFTRMTITENLHMGAYVRNDKAGIVHCTIGKASFSADALKENLGALLADLVKAKPAAAKGQFLQKVSVSTTMGIGITVDQSTLGVKQ